MSKYKVESEWGGITYFFQSLLSIQNLAAHDPQSNVHESWNPQLRIDA